MSFFKKKGRSLAILQKLSLLFFTMLMISCSKDDEVSEIIDFAALELQNYIEKISKITLPIVTRSSKANETYSILLKIIQAANNHVEITSNANHIIISGRSDLAVKNVVYEFLERFLNCRWYAPNIEEIPSLA